MVPHLQLDEFLKGTMRVSRLRDLVEELRLGSVARRGLDQEAQHTPRISLGIRMHEVHFRFRRLTIYRVLARRVEMPGI